MSDTPRTDAVFNHQRYAMSDDFNAMHNHAETLERELTTLRAVANEMEKETRELLQAIEDRLARSPRDLPDSLQQRQRVNEAFEKATAALARYAQVKGEKS